MLQIEDLTVEYQSGDYVVRPLDRFNLRCEPGELVLLLGASGCGKTTLLSAMAGILRPTSGRVLVGGKDVTTLHGAALTEYRRHDVGVVFQAFNLIPSLSAVENVQAALRVAGVSGSRARRRATELIDRVGLTERAGNKPSQMSGGQQQRVAIARALAHDPPLILADEPTAHLDFVQCEVVLTILRELTADGRTVVIATHDDRLLPLADRVVELTPRFAEESRAGEVVEVAAGHELFRQGDASDHVYLIEDGAIEVLRERVDGSTERLAVLEAGRYVGELGPLLGLQRSATARTMTPCRLEIQSPQVFRARVGALTLGDRLERSAATPPPAADPPARAPKKPSATKRTATPTKHAGAAKKTPAAKKTTATKKAAAANGTKKATTAAKATKARATPRS